MATPTPTVVASAVMAAESDGIDNGATTTQHAEANYFFGFLITFIILFLLFAGCGIGSRRRFLARRRALFPGTSAPWATTTASGEYQRPVLYEKLIVVGKDDWKSIMPLSAHIIHESKETDQEDYPALPSESPVSVIPENVVITDVNPPISVPAWIREGMTPKPPLPEEKPKEQGFPRLLQMAVLIKMPHPNNKDSKGSPPASLSKVSIDIDDDRRQRNNHAHTTTGPIPGFEIGVLHIHIPWHPEGSSSGVNLNQDRP